MLKGDMNFGSRRFRDMETGEEIEVQTIYQDAKDSNFVKIWLAHLLMGLEELGNKKIKVLIYLLENRIVSHNIIAKTLQEIATETGVSYPTVSETIHILERRNLIKRKTGVIYLSPSMIFKGSHDNRMRIMYEFRNVGKELAAAPETEPANAKESEDEIQNE
jgi:DNA-binding Lrp family transcriptional regulator